jgi:GMP reductase
MTGVGYPQLSAVIECAEAAHGLRGHICADGGCKVPGDLVKAFGGGADFVMLGGMFAGHEECGEANADGLVEFRGMSSHQAMVDHYGAQSSYRAAEGRELYIPAKGPVLNTLREILGGIRSGMTLIGAENLKDIPKCAEFVLTGRQLNTMYGR